MSNPLRAYRRTELWPTKRSAEKHRRKMTKQGYVPVMVPPDHEIVLIPPDIMKQIDQCAKILNVTRKQALDSVGYIGLQALIKEAEKFQLIQVPGPKKSSVILGKMKEEEGKLII